MQILKKSHPRNPDGSQSGDNNSKDKDISLNEINDSSFKKFRQKKMQKEKRKYKK